MGLSGLPFPKASASIAVKDSVDSVDRLGQISRPIWRHWLRNRSPMNDANYDLECLRFRLERCAPGDERSASE